MRVGVGGVAIFAIASGCGSHDDPDALQSVCAGAASARVLELGEDEDFQLRPRIGDRFVITVFTPRGPVSEATSVEHWSVGSCGEDPVRLDLVGVPFESRSALFDCSDEGIGLADPRGESPSRMIAPGLTCFGARPSGGLLAADPADGTIGALEGDGTFTPWLSNAQVLADGDTPLALQRQEMAGGVLALVDDDERLHLLDAETGATSAVIDGVHQVNLDSEGVVAILVRRREPNHPWDPPMYGSYLLDLRAGTEVGLGEGDLSTYPIVDGWIIRKGFYQEPRAFRLATSEAYDPPLPDARRGWTGPHGRVGFQARDSTSGEDRLWAWEPLSGEVTMLAGPDDDVHLGSRGAFVSPPADAGELVEIDFVEYGGDRIDAFAEGVSGPLFHAADGSLLWFGPVTDGVATLFHRRLDGELRILEQNAAFTWTEVRVGSTGWSYDEGYDRLLWPRVDWGESSEVLYGVRDAARSGIWRARLSRSD